MYINITYTDFDKNKKKRHFYINDVYLINIINNRGMRNYILKIMIEIIFYDLILKMLDLNIHIDFKFSRSYTFLSLRRPRRWRHGLERYPHMRKTGVRIPATTDLSRKNR